MATFGFSVGDFLAALKLVGTIIDALRASGHSSTRYRNLLTELYTLEDALIRVKRLDIADDDDNGSQASERMALQQAAGLCQRSMYEFYKKIEKYQPHLTMRATGGDWLKDGWMKIKWATCRTEDVELFQAELRGHRGSIEILLLTLQLYVHIVSAIGELLVLTRAAEVVVRCRPRLRNKDNGPWLAKSRICRLNGWESWRPCLATWLGNMAFLDIWVYHIYGH